MDRVSLVLSPPWQQERLVLLRRTDAIPLCRDGGYQELPWRQACVHVGGLPRRDLGDVRAFVARARLGRFPLADFADGELVAFLVAALRQRDLVVLRIGETATGGDDGTTAEQRRLVRQIEARARRRLSHAGRQYKLVADVDLNRLRERDSYEVVGRQAAVQVLGALAQQASVDNRELAPLLVQAQVKLSGDWRPPLSPDGLVLLRRIVTLGSQAPDAAEAITPSQLKKLLTKTEWIEIEVVDERGVPYTGPYRVELPDGAVREGKLDEKGMWADYDIEPGQCKLLLPEVVEDVKPGEGAPPSQVEQTTWIAFKLVDDEGHPIVGRSYRVELSDGSERTGTTGDGEIRIDPIAPGTCVLALTVEGAALSGELSERGVHA